MDEQPLEPMSRRGCLVVLVVCVVCWAVLILAGIGAWVVVRALWP